MRRRRSAYSRPSLASLVRAAKPDHIGSLTAFAHARASLRSFGRRSPITLVRSLRSLTPEPRFARSGGEARSHWFAHCVRSLVSPPLVSRRDRRALVLHRDAAERIVLALRMAIPVVGHQDAGECGVSVVDDPEHVPGLALLPIRARVQPGDGWDVRVVDRYRDFQTNSAAIGHR